MCVILAFGLKNRTKTGRKKRGGVPHGLKVEKSLVTQWKSDFQTVPLSVDRAGT